MASAFAATIIPFCPILMPALAAACQVWATTPGTKVAVSKPIVGTFQLTSPTSVEASSARSSSLAQSGRRGLRPFDFAPPVIAFEPMQTALEAISEYYSVFSTLDLNAIASHFSEPCMSIGPQGVFSAANRAELAAAFAPTVASLTEKGYGWSELLDPVVTTLGETAAFVAGVAVRYTAAGQELERIPISYVMHRSESAWKIAMMVLAG
jgi:ketosteroid isomerase-like protein